jgi:hypothetical protein
MLSVDGLLVFQASNCNWQVLAKIYEYISARRPILAVTDPEGDAARVLKNEAIDTIGMLNSKEDTTRALLDFLAQIRAGTAPIASDSGIARHSRYTCGQGSSIARRREPNLSSRLVAAATSGRSDQDRKRLTRI